MKTTVVLQKVITSFGPMVKAFNKAGKVLFTAPSLYQAVRLCRRTNLVVEAVL